jgi:hypothetical protein
LDQYVGYYAGQPWVAEYAIVRWGGGLSCIGLPLCEPSTAVHECQLLHVGGDVFRRERPNEEGLGEEWQFLRDAVGDAGAAAGMSGEVLGFTAHSQWHPRIAPPSMEARKSRL